MRKICIFILMFALSIVGFSGNASAAESHAVYVSKNGSDSGNGSFSAPFASLKKAIEYTRNLTGEKYIFIRGGNYNIPQTINLTSADNNLTVCNYGGEKVTFSAATEIPFTYFEKVTDTAILDRIIEENGKNTVMQIYLPKVGITSYGQISSPAYRVGGTSFAPSLICNKKMMYMAEYPNRGTLENGGYLYTSQVSGGNSFVCDNERVANYQTADEPWVLGFFNHDWSETISPVTINGNSIKLSASSSYGIKDNRRVRFFNLLEELDAPGEFYIDRKTGYLYIIPPNDIQNGDTLSFTSANIRFISCTRSQNIVFRGLIFEGTLSNALSLGNCNNITVDNCEFYGIGDTAVSINACTNSGIINSSFHDLQSKGIQFYNCGNRNTLTESGCFVTNCRFERFSQYRRTYVPAVEMHGCGFLISNNYFGDSPHFAIQYTSNNAVIEYNEFDNVCNDTSDAGTIYSGRDWSTQGNIIRCNYFHDTKRIYSTAGYEVNSVYLDDCHSSTKVYKNIFYKCPTPGLFGGGRYNTFENNMIFECTKPFVMDARGETWNETWLQENSSSSIYKKLKRFDYKNGAWAEQYPYLADMLEDEPKVPKHNTIKNNLEYRSGGFNIHDDVIKYGDVKYNSSVSNVSFLEDYSNKDFTIKDISKIKSRIPDFEDIPFNKMGTQQTEVPSKPYTTVEKLSGTANFYDTLRLKYSSKSDSCKIADNIIRWYTVNNGQRIEIKGENSGTLKLGENFAGKTVTASVTPIDSNGTLGYTIWFGNVNVSNINYSDVITAEKTTDGLKINNTSGSSIGIFVFGADYSENGGYKTMTALEFLGITAEETEDIDITGDNVILASGKTLEPITVK